MYKHFWKRIIDLVVSGIGIIVSAIPMLFIAGLIKLSDSGPALFKQKRVGIHKRHFMLLKFRSMKMSTPHDIPTHQLRNPEQYLLKIGAFLRKYSLDELPQLFNIFRGEMSIIGPRPALWNQEDLIAERDKYGANDVKPGLSGWAQINGRDELEIPVKARLDGEYVKQMSFLFDCRCFFGTVGKVLKHDGVLEGGTGRMRKSGHNYIKDKKNEELIGHIGFGKTVKVDRKTYKKVLITGAGSYIGESFVSYTRENYGDSIRIDTVDMIDGSWRRKDFSEYDIVYHVAGIAHADVGNVNKELKDKYYSVNTDLAIEVCKKAKEEGVKEFIFMSSMIVYGSSAPYGKKKVIDEHTVPSFADFYGDSKLQADVAVRALASNNFKVIVLRPPMIYGKGSKGNYPVLAKLAKKLPVFPDIDNERSMLYIDNFCEFLCQVILVRDFEENAIVLIPQNAEWTKTSMMVKEIAAVNEKKICLIWMMKPIIIVGSRIPGKIGKLINKAFGNNCYANKLSTYPGIEYQKISLKESIKHTEGKKTIGDNLLGNKKYNKISKSTQKHILVVSQYFYPEIFRINDICQEWVRRKYKVTVVTGIPNYPMGKIFKGYGLTKKRHEFWNGIEVYRIPLIPRGSSSIGMIVNYISFAISGIVAGFTKNIEADYVFSFEVSPMTQVLTGITFAKKLGVPHYLYVQDLWPENIVAVTGTSNSVVIKLIDKMVDYIYKNTDEIFVSSPSFVNAICNRKVKVCRQKVHYWPQYAEEFFCPREDKSAKEIPADNSFKIIFTGNFGTAQGLDILPRTAELLKEEDIKFVMVGDGRYLKDFNKEVKNRHVTNKFIMIPRQPVERIPELLSMCDVAFLSFQDTDLWTMTIPAKLQSYMACGMPVIAAAQGETKRIINEAGCGVCSTIGDANELSQVIKEMMTADLVEMGTKSRAYFKKNFDKKMLMDQMEKYFRK